ncbi:MAG TPA: sulfur carrier protein ThiS [Pirellulaceae bacterium]|jgi:sulfur carrier protein
MISAITDKSIEIIVNGQPRDIAVATTVAVLLHELEIPLRGVAVEINDQIVPRAQHAEQFLCSGDRLEIVSLVGGG